MRLSDNQVGDRLHAALEAVGTEEGETTVEIPSWSLRARH
jgi:hypothetical protein